MPQQLYIKSGSLPVPLPSRIRLSDGRIRTNPASFTPEEIADAGYLPAAPRPVPAAHQVVSWGGTDWVIRDKTTDELAAEADAVRAALHSDLAAYRYDVEIGGVDLPGGGRVHTDRVSQAMIDGAVATLDRGYVTSVQFKGASGWMELDATAMTQIAQLVAQHVQACFAAERAVSEGIDALTDAELAGFDPRAAFDTELGAT